jgi:hypothetical protein
MKDPFHRQIIDVLEAKDFDPLVFERCVCDLLRGPYPGLIPVSGPQDAGMDGAIADGQGAPYPLVCTTNDNVIGNLTKSLETYLAKVGRRRQVVLATSIALKPPSRRKFEDRAEELGFTLDLYDQEAIADRLYSSERWCRELLGIAWRPQVLSPVPPPSRAQLEIDLIGRDADVEWLENTSGDRLITGQPGSGKTFLLHHLTRKGWGVFLHGDDPAAIRNALCEQSPKVVIVDDSHEDAGRLLKLRALRQEIDQNFDIVATCWEGERGSIAEALGSLPAQIRRLELLTRDQIVEIFRQAGVQVSHDFLRLLVDQSANKPGLAGTLATLVLRDSWVEVLRGDALARSLMTDLKKLVGPESSDFLAVLGIGGERGMSLEAAGKFLEIGLAKTRDLAIGLAAGGVLSEEEDRALAVRPVALRSALVRQTFFEGPATLDYRPLLDQAPSYESAVAAIVIAAGYGAEVPPQELRELVKSSAIPEPWQRTSEASHVWQLYTELGEDEARWVLENYPGDVIDVAANALWRAPRAAIPRLLERAASDVTPDEPVLTSPDRPLDLLRSWMLDLSAEQARQGTLIDRRRCAVQVAKRYVEGGGAGGVAAQVLFMAISPRLEGTRRDPGMGRTITMSQGLLPPDQLLQLETLWQDGGGVIGEIDSQVWDSLQSISWDWSHPGSITPGIPLDPAARDALSVTARRVLQDLAPLAEGSPGLSTGLSRLARRAGIELDLPSDPVFELLYPPNHPSGAEPDPATMDALDDLAGRWSAEQQPGEAAEALVRYEDEAERIGQHWPRLTPELCRLLAERVGDPEHWAVTFLDHQLSPDLLRPLLEKMLEARRPGWDQILARCLDIEVQSWGAARMVLQLSEPPADLLKLALSKASDFPQLIQTLCLRREVPLSTLEALLDHPDPQVALAAAVGEWNADPRGQVTDPIRAQWREVILQSAQHGSGDITGPVDLDYWLGHILASDSKLARDWIEVLIDRDVDLTFLTRDPVFEALNALTEADRLRILDKLQPGRFALWELPRLVNRNAAVYRKFLEIDRLKSCQLRPLEGQPDGNWAELAKLALEAGHEPLAIARAAFDSTHVFSEYSPSAWDRSFAKLEDDAVPNLREVARHGRQMAQAELQTAAARQRELELEGY